MQLLKRIMSLYKQGTNDVHGIYSHVCSTKGKSMYRLSLVDAQDTGTSGGDGDQQREKTFHYVSSFDIF